MTDDKLKYKVLCRKYYYDLVIDMTLYFDNGWILLGNVRTTDNNDSWYCTMVNPNYKKDTKND